MRRVSTKSNLSAPDKILCAALDLFHERGVQATSVDDILAASGTGKSQLYHHFKSKEGVVHALLQKMHQCIKNNEGPINQHIKSWKDMEQWLRKPGEIQDDDCKRGCPLGTIASTLAPEDELLRQDIRLIVEALKAGPKEFFTAQKAMGKLKPDADPESMAMFCFTIMQGGALQSKIDRCTDSLRESIDHALAHLKSFVIE